MSRQQLASRPVYSRGLIQCCRKRARRTAQKTPLSQRPRQRRCLAVGGWLAGRPSARSIRAALMQQFPHMYASCLGMEWFLYRLASSSLCPDTSGYTVIDSPLRWPNLRGAGRNRLLAQGGGDGQCSARSVLDHKLSAECLELVRWNLVPRCRCLKSQHDPGLLLYPAHQAASRCEGVLGPGQLGLSTVYKGALCLFE